MKKIPIAFMALILSMCFPLFSAQAHMLWLMPSAETTEPGKPVYVELGWGHKLPRDQFMPIERLEKLSVLGPGGNSITPEKIFPTIYKFTPMIQGTYHIIAKVRPGFLSITTDGHKLGDKTTVENVVSCFHFIMSAATCVKVGEKSQGHDLKNGEPLQIIPLMDPADLSVGDMLPLKVLFNGKPLAGTVLQAASEDLSKKGQAKDMSSMWIQEQTTGDDGIVQIKLETGGMWVLRVNHKTPYPDKKVCDEYSYSTTLTVRPRP